MPFPQRKYLRKERAWEPKVQAWFWDNVDVDTRHHKMLPALLVLLAEQIAYETRKAYDRGYRAGQDSTTKVIEI